MTRYSKQLERRAAADERIREYIHTPGSYDGDHCLRLAPGWYDAHTGCIVIIGNSPAEVLEAVRHVRPLCWGCYRDPCECLPDDAPADPPG